jgi:putative phosphoesterase
VSTRVLVLADTHVQRGGSRRLPDRVYELLEEVDVVWHAGDVLIPELLHELEGFAPVTAVLGNNDHELVGVLPDRVEEMVEGVRIAMVHDSGATHGRERRMARWFPDADLVIFGHSHAPAETDGIDGQRLLNPGSPIERRRAPTHTVGLVDVDGDRFATRLVDV